jgi:hypothetical protein
MMAGRFLADENLPRACVAAMRTAGYDVSWICEQTTAISDEDVCRMAMNGVGILRSSAKMPSAYDPFLPEPDTPTLRLIDKLTQFHRPRSINWRYSFNQSFQTCL